MRQKSSRFERSLSNDLKKITRYGNVSNSSLGPTALSLCVLCAAAADRARGSSEREVYSLPWRGSDLPERVGISVMRGWGVERGRVFSSSKAVGKK